MKDRVREAVFNLIGPEVKGKEVIDLFGGTGAMSFEALSRGAASATVIERSFPNAKVIQENANSLGVATRIQVRAGDAFIVSEQLPIPPHPVLVFCCPPYDFYLSRAEELLKLIERFRTGTAPGSLILIEADTRFDVSLLGDAPAWDVRTYSPAVIGIYEVGSSAERL